MKKQNKMDTYNIIWFRHGLRIHDNPALLEAIRPDAPGRVVHLIPVFIFDGESAGNNFFYNSKT